MLKIPPDVAWLERAEKMCVEHRTLFDMTAKSALFADVSSNYSDLVSATIADVRFGTYKQVPDDLGQLVAFLQGVIKNRARHLNRSASRHVALSEKIAAQGDWDAWRIAERVILRSDLAEAMSTLTPRQRQVADLHWINGCTTRDAAWKLQISERTVKELLRRARKTLKENLLRHRTYFE